MHVWLGVESRVHVGNCILQLSWAWGAGFLIEEFCWRSCGDAAQRWKTAKREQNSHVITMQSPWLSHGAGTSMWTSDVCAPNVLVGEDGLMSDSDTAELTPDGINAVKSSRSWPSNSTQHRRRQCCRANCTITLIPRFDLSLLFFLPCSSEDSMSHVCWEEQQSHKFRVNKRAASRGVKFYARTSSGPDLLWQIAIMLHGCVINSSSVRQVVLSL